jgi:sporulation protein YlmC with PRC-barrel domain
MATWDGMSFYQDLLYKQVVDRDGQAVGAIGDLATRQPNGTIDTPTVQRLVIRPHQVRRNASGRSREALVLAWDLVGALEHQHIRLRRTQTERAPSSLEAGQILLRKHIMDQQIVDCRGLKLHRVNDIAMGFSEGALRLLGMDTMRGFVTRLAHRWGLLRILRPLHDRLHQRLICSDFVERVEPARGHIRLRLSRDEVRPAILQAPPSVD